LGLYFVSKRLTTELPDRYRDDIVAALFHARTNEAIYLYAFVVMPDHWHALFSLRTEEALGTRMNAICRYASFEWRHKSGAYQWQSGFHDHKLRPGESVVDTVRYIETNPVRKSLVAFAKDWRWSSANPGFAGDLDRSFLGMERWRE
jgi:putative transposase